jgi:hypothetical protein
MAQDYIHYSEITLEIGWLCDQKASGTVFIATRDNHIAQMMLDQGEIVFIFFAGKRGQEALNLVTEIREGRYRFQEGGVVSRGMQLPPTQDILRALSSGSAQASSPADEAHAPDGNGLSPEQKTVLETCLTDCIGPMAAIICEDHFASASSFQAAVDALAAEIPSPGQARKFREMVAKGVG